MNYRGVLFLLGRLLLGLSLALLVPAAVALLMRSGEMWEFLYAAGITFVSGIVLQQINRDDQLVFGRAEAFLLVSAAWTTASLVGALPYIFLKGPSFIIDAIFESASGFTTTGASILTDVESETPALLLWRSLTQWLGGMGIIVMGIAVLPKLAIGGMQLLGAEAPGPTTEKLTPRIAQTAKALWGIYGLLTLAQTSILMLLGMGLLEAVNHSLSTMATGGFSTRNASVGAFGPAIQLVITLFMVMAGVNFALHFALLRGRPNRLLKDSEFRFYIGVISVATVLLSGNLLLDNPAGGIFAALRLAAFQATTITSTTGFATANFDAWPDFSRALLFLLMFVGGCAGSTGGSVKVVRILIVLKKMAIELKRLVQPHAVLPVRIGRAAIPDEVVTQVTTFFILFLSLFAAGGLILSFMGLELVTAYSASAACLGNIGPGFVGVGPTQTYAPLPAVAKLVLVGLMIVGRLELYTALVAIYLLRKSGGGRT